MCSSHMPSVELTVHTRGPACKPAVLHVSSAPSRSLGGRSCRSMSGKHAVCPGSGEPHQEPVVSAWRRVVSGPGTGHRFTAGLK